MNRWKRLCTHGSIWLVSELVLGMMGLDNLADYSEFLQARGEVVSKPPIVTLI